ncbi:YjbH domain-containing protein [Pseudoxanthomonas suwonensis]|uniref:YjbH domain-containing protein n=1 Tax=Pseudoxanthomonas suwonensis TaxID=314722 RepID=UPI00048F71DF|nr:YjbH domain-containing protein [Pseudoxanthomonas suwonensis]
MPRSPVHRLAPAASLLALAISGSLHAEVPVTQSVWGGAGLLQNPTARMAPEGELSFVASHTSPYSRYNFSLQPFPWLEASFRYINVAGVRYGPDDLSGDQNYKDKSVDFKLRLWEESRWLPQVAFGMRDLGGTGFFASEYLVASKRFGDFDATLGLATGYLGSNGDFANPLRWIDDRFEDRPDIGGAGQLNWRAMLRGPVGVFGGVAWQTPHDPLLVKVEYDGHNYDNERRIGKLPQDSRINLGLHYRIRPGVQVMLGWERGNELSAALVLRGNPGHGTVAAHPLDPKREPLVERAASVERAMEAATAPSTADTTATVLLPGESWAGISSRLGRNAGIDVHDISVADRELIVRGNQGRYRRTSEGLDRAARIVANSTDGIDWVTVEHERRGLPVAQASVSVDALRAHDRGDIDSATLSRSVELNPPGSSRLGTVVHEEPLDRFSFQMSPGFRHIMGGPDGFLLYQLSANASAEWRSSRNTWLSGTVSANLFDNFDKFKYDAPSKLPRVRTDMRKYVTTSEVTVPVLQLTHTRSMGRDLYGMAYAGLFESMFGGVGGEMLYRPFGEPWAVSVDVNWVKQRDFDQHFSFRDYETGTGHATFYYSLDRERRVHASLAAGRYLAGDWGATLTLARVFDNGVTMGAWATRTNVSSEEFGEGSFDKGIFVTIPFDHLLPRSVPGRFNLVWNPLVRDGGARLSRPYSLYGMTGERDRRSFFNEPGF